MIIIVKLYIPWTFKSGLQVVFPKPLKYNQYQASCKNCIFQKVVFLNFKLKERALLKVNKIKDIFFNQYQNSLFEQKFYSIKLTKSTIKKYILLHYNCLQYNMFLWWTVTLFLLRLANLIKVLALPWSRIRLRDSNFGQGSL